MCVCARARVRVRVCVRAHVCACVCDREGGQEGGGGRRDGRDHSTAFVVKSLLLSKVVAQVASCNV